MADVPSFEKVVLQGIGKFERATGLDQVAATQFQSLESRSNWALITFVRKLGDVLGMAPNLTFVGVSQGQVLGTASIILLHKTGYIMGVATDPSARRRGIATHLLEQAHLAAQKRGRAWLALDVESENEAAARVYQRLGYREKAVFSWYTGQPPVMNANVTGIVNEVPNSRMGEVASWVAHNQTPAIHEAFPATKRRLSHFEIVTKLPGSPVKTWELSGSGRTAAVVRGSYLPAIKAGYVIPASPDQALPADSLVALLTPAASWLRSLGATRMVVPIPEPTDSYTPTMAALGLTKAVSTALMIRPA